ncbi:hypothetical protein Tco_0361512 [Tanacetum coccineum]
MLPFRCVVPDFGGVTDYPKWDAAGPIDGDNLQEVFGPDKRERPASKQRAGKKNRLKRRGAPGEANRSLYRHLFLKIIDVNVMLLKEHTRRRGKKI